MSDIHTDYTPELATKDEATLRVIAGKLDIHPHHKAGKDTIIKQISAQQGALIADALKAIAEEEIKPKLEFYHSEDTIRSAIKAQLDKDGFKAVFDNEEDTWHFSYRGRDECGTMRQPLKTIRQKAANVAEGPRRLRGLQGDDGIGRGYSSNILM